MVHTLSAELPPALSQFLAWSDERFAAMSSAERRLAQGFLAADEVIVAVLTEARVDVGLWRGSGRLWAFALRHDLALVAHGPRPVAERIPYTLLRQSTYNPVTGELALAPGPHHHVRGLRMPPLEGYQMLAQIYQETTTDATTSH